MYRNTEIRDWNDFFMQYEFNAPAYMHWTKTLTLLFYVDKLNIHSICPKINGTYVQAFVLTKLNLNCIFQVTVICGQNQLSQPPFHVSSAPCKCTPVLTKDPRVIVTMQVQGRMDKNNKGPGGARPAIAHCVQVTGRRAVPVPNIYDTHLALTDTTLAPTAMFSRT